MAAASEIDVIKSEIAPMSVEFYHESTALGWIDGDIELLRGIPVKKISKSPLHEYLIERLQEWLLKQIPSGYRLLKERPLTTHDSQPEPDLMVVQGKIDDFKYKHPQSASLVIEVCLNTADRDRLKAAIYAEAGVSEYWIVEPETQSVTVHRNPTHGVYLDVEVIEDGDASPKTFVCGDLSLSELFD
ncbi:MAG: Uma2 family endonuclease [Verrucomicrobiota bacterium]